MIEIHLVMQMVSVWFVLQKKIYLSDFYHHTKWQKQFFKGGKYVFFLPFCWIKSSSNVNQSQQSLWIINWNSSSVKKKKDLAIEKFISDDMNMAIYKQKYIYSSSSRSLG